MKILRLQIDNFGKLQNYRLELDGGLNLLCRENGWGKSTLAVFIKAMLYGLPASTKRDLDSNERKKYTPWQGGAFGGSMEFETKKGKFRVERYFGVKEANDTFALFDLSTNLPSAVYSASLGEELFGINAEGFERSTYLSQRDISEKNGSGSISARLGNLLDAVDDIDTYDTALEILEKRRKFYVLSGNRGAIAETEQEIATQELELERLQQRAAALTEQAKRYEAEEETLIRLTERAEALRKQQKQAGRARERALLQEQKNQKLSALAAIRQRQQDIEASFSGPLPTADECKGAHELYDKIAKARARVNALNEPIPGADTLETLRKKYANGIPSSEQLAAMDADNKELLLLTSRQSLLLSEQATTPQTRLSGKLPTEDELNHAFALCSRADHAKEEVARLQASVSEEAHSPILSWISLLSLALGVALLVLCAIRPQMKLWLPLLCGGIVCAIAGGVLFLSSLLGSKKHRKKADAVLAQLQAAKQAERTSREELKRFLLSYGAPVSADLEHDLTAFSTAISRNRTALERQSHIAQELQAVTGKITAVSNRLRERLAPYLGALPQKDNYQTHLDLLRHEVAEWKRLANASFKQKEECELAAAQRDALQNSLRPFLARFRPDAPAQAFERIRIMEEQCREMLRLQAEYTKQDADLRTFIAEKKPDDAPVSPAVDFAALEREEKALRDQIQSLNAQHATQKGLLDRISMDTDRIPDVIDALENAKLRLSEYKDNYATIQATQRLLEEAKNALSVRYLDGMQASFSKYLKALVGKDAPESVMNTEFEVQLRDGGKTHAMESFSRGWRDAVRFCVRLSLADALYADGEAPLLLLDDPFVNLDDRRLAAAKKLLDALASEYQILYMVCRKEN